MLVASLISVEEYLKTSYRPDREYVDGEILERNSGERDHSRIQRDIMICLVGRYPHLHDRIYPEQRLQMKATRFRVPDLCLLAQDAPEEQIVRSSPEWCVEVLSPADTLSRLTERLEDYFGTGVPHCWIIDPLRREAWVATPGHMDKASDGVLRASGIELPLTEVFKFQPH